MSKVILTTTSSQNFIDDIAYMARVSNPSNQKNTDTSEKLIRYLIKHAHWSPFEMCSITMEINTTRDIAHQIVRHRSFTFQEFSQRYADPAEMGYPFELRETRLQDPKNRQNSIQIQDDRLDNDWKGYQENVLKAAQGAYDWALRNGIAKEQARAVLPEGLTRTRLYMQGTLRSWLHFIQTRTTPGTQLEHMEVARQCADVIRPLFTMVDDFVHDNEIV